MAENVRAGTARVTPILVATAVVSAIAGFLYGGALYASVALAVTYVIMNCVGLAIVDRVGRRRLSLIMTPGAALALTALGAVFVFGADSASTALFIVVCLITFMLFTAGGLQVMGWLTGSEVYPLGVRSAAWRTSRPRSGRAHSAPVASPSKTKAKKGRPPDPTPNPPAGKARSRYSGPLARRASGEVSRMGSCRA